MNYQYWLVRYVPNTLRGEFVNVAVIVGATGRDWALRRTRNLRRANRLGGNSSAIEPWLARAERSIRDYQEPPLEVFSEEQATFSSAWLTHAQGRLNNSLRLSDPTPIEASSALEGAELLFDLLVGDSAVTHQTATQRRLIRDLHHTYLSFGPDAQAHLLQRPRAEVGRQRGRFDFAVVDNAVDQLSHVWSFDIQNLDDLEQEMQSWSYLVTRLRNDGGHLVAPNSLIPAHAIAPDVDIAVVYQEPAVSTPQRQDLYLAAREAWEQLRVDAVPSSQLERVVHRVAA